MRGSEASYKLIETATRQVEASIQQNKLQVILSTMERFSNEEFDGKRKKVRGIVKKYQANEWKGYFDPEDNYLVRGFIALYDTTAMKPTIDYYRLKWSRNATKILDG